MTNTQTQSGPKDKPATHITASSSPGTPCPDDTAREHFRYVRDRGYGRMPLAHLKACAVYSRDPREEPDNHPSLFSSRWEFSKFSAQQELRPLARNITDPDRAGIPKKCTEISPNVRALLFQSISIEDSILQGSFFISCEKGIAFFGTHYPLDKDKFNIQGQEKVFARKKKEFTKSPVSCSLTLENNVTQDNCILFS